MRFQEPPNALDPGVLGWTPRTWAILDDGNHRVWGAVSINLPEAERRRDLDVGAIDDPLLVNFLWSLPSGGHVRRSDLGPAETRLVDRLAPTHIEGTDRLQRIAMPPLRIDALIAVADHGPGALAALGRRWWAPIQIAVCDRPASERTRRDASRWGIGLVENGTCTVEARRRRQIAHGPLQWRTAESAFAKVLDCAAQRRG